MEAVFVLEKQVSSAEGLSPLFVASVLFRSSSYISHLFIHSRQASLSPLSVASILFRSSIFISHSANWASAISNLNSPFPSSTIMIEERYSIRCCLLPSVDRSTEVIYHELLEF